LWAAAPVKLATAGAEVLAELMGIIELIELIEVPAAATAVVLEWLSPSWLLEEAA